MTPGLTPDGLQSTGSSSPAQAPIESPRQTVQYAVLNAYSVNRYPKPAARIAIADDPRINWPIEHYAIHMEPHTHTALPKNDVIPRDLNGAIRGDATGHSCSGASRNTSSTKRKKISEEERDNIKRVRAQGACLRCYVQKLKCSEGLPCNQCQGAFNRAHGSRMLQWTACISSKLSELNIFRLGASLSAHRKRDGTNPFEPWNIDATSAIDASTAHPLLEAGAHIMDSFGLLAEFDSIYTEVLEHAYGHQAAKIHPFVLRERNPLHMLVQLNVVLLGSSIIGHKIVGYVRFLQVLRAAYAVVSFQCLEKALERNMLVRSSPKRQLALIVQAALLLDQVIEMSPNASTVATCFARGKYYEDLYQHLVQYLSYYLRMLISRVFGESCSLAKSVQDKSGCCFSETFWDDLADLIPTIPLRRPRKIRGFTDRNPSSTSDEVDLEGLFQQLHFSQEAKD
ncbi:hypothetical protein K458DRAFT_420761 [Lentithecium fluviatile CBS 122367]|uniref:Zn(2)-C6 fungal-type domain-containing protein n=1 Tax=Lentithecium fluviatile CBS 122367 TaxID=1168545 RepID=A0A6G1ISN2_9PLEO|nr:hypothetical protein K458DRAFT_420761 [Lentithecium fluviatile CBS 122367]